MRIRIIGVSDRKIQAIKGLRAVTGLDLKEAKDVIEAASDSSNAQPVVDVSEGANLTFLGVDVYWEYALPDVSLSDLVKVLALYPQDVTV